MKAKRIAIAISSSMILALVLSGCGSQSSSDSGKIKALEQRVQDLEFRLNVTTADLRRLRSCVYYAPSGAQALINLSFCR